jgi:hypothetical protein
MVSYQADISALASAHAPDRKNAAYETLISLYYWYVVHIKTVDKELVALIKAGAEI